MSYNNLIRLAENLAEHKTATPPMTRRYFLGKLMGTAASHAIHKDPDKLAKNLIAIATKTASLKRFYHGSPHDIEQIEPKIGGEDANFIILGGIDKKAEAEVATKRDPAKWERAKEEAKAKMGGKHSARAMQLAVKIYKDEGGTYAGKKPTPSNNSMRKWTKQDWQTRPGTSEIAQKSDGSTSRYLPKKKWDSLSKKEQVATDAKKLNADTQYISNTDSAKVKGSAKYY